MEINRLEQALRRATIDRSTRADFYQVLMESTVLVLGTSAEQREASSEEIRILHSVKPDGSPLIPFFSSIEALEQAITDDQSYMEIPARSLFEATRGAYLYLDPRSDFGTEFTPHEIEFLLSSAAERSDTRPDIGNQTEALLSQPAEYPAAMVEALVEFLSEKENVQTAWLAMIDNPSDGQPPHLVLGIEADEEWEEVIREAGIIAADTAPGDEPIDLFRVVRQESMLARYFAEKTAPFYERSRDARPKE